MFASVNCWVNIGSDNGLSPDRRQAIFLEGGGGGGGGGGGD